MLGVFEYPRGAYLPYHLRVPFNTLPDEVENAALAVIGGEILMPKAPRCLYHSQVLSIFLSNTFDMIPDYRILMRLAAKCIKQEFPGVDVLRQAVKRYSLRGSEAWVASHFREARDFSLFRNLMMSITDFIPTQILADAFFIYYKSANVSCFFIGKSLLPG